MNPKLAPANEEKKVTAAVAQPLFIEHFPLKYKVTDKFWTDHICKDMNLSKKTSIEAAVKRYVGNQHITKSSWILLDQTTLLNKAAGAQKRASVHNGGQQMTLGIKVTRRTVTIEKLTFKEKDRIEHQVVKIGAETQYLSCSSASEDLTICVIGPWKPLTGEVELYHYEEAALPPSPIMLDVYLKWTWNPALNTYVAPVAKK